MPRILEIWLARAAVESGLVGRADLEGARAAQEREGVPVPPLGVVLVERGCATHAQVAQLLGGCLGSFAGLDPNAAEKTRAWRFAALAVELGLAGTAAVDRALREQTRREEAGGGAPCVPLARLLVEAGVVTETQVADFLRRPEAAGLAVGAAQGAATLLTPSVAAPAPAEPPATTLPHAAPVPSCAPAPVPLPAAPVPTGTRPAVATILGEPISCAPAPSTPATARTSPPEAAAAPPFGKYQILEELGRGGMGIVYRAYDTELRREVALKTLFRGEGSDPQMVERLLREARTAGTLDHPGIVQIHEVGTIAGMPYFAMAFIKGRTLHDVLATGGLPSLRERARVVCAAAEAVAHAHERRVIHRDLKPGNLLLDAEGRVHVMDFGLAKRLDESTRLTVAGQMMGTPQYMPPEQIDGDLAAIGPATDVYALGAVLYEALTGRLPFAGGTVAEIVSKALVSDPAPPRRIDARIPADLETICLKALAREPRRRYPSARELALDLRRYLEGEAIAARPDTWPTQALRWARRRRSMLIPTAALGVVAIGAGFWGWRSHASGAAERERARTAQAQAAESERRAQEQRRKLLGRIRTAVLDYENTVMGEAMSETLRRKLAEQPLGVIEELIALEPEYGPAYGWRGKVRELLRLEQPAEEDLDRACTLAPESAVVWYLRGMHYVEKYAVRRSLPTASWGGSGIKVQPQAADAPEEKAWRERGLSDLARMRAAAARDPALGEDEARLGRAMADLYAGGREQYEAAVRALAGLDLAKAHKLRGLALCLVQRFAEAAEEFTRATAAWPADPMLWHYRGMAHASAGVTGQGAGGGGGDGRASFQRAITDYGRALQLNPGFVPGYIARGNAHEGLGLVEEACGEDPRGSIGRAIAEYDEALRRDPDSVSAFRNRGNACRALGDAEAAHGEDPRPTYRRAIADLGAALQRDPASGDAYNRRSLAWRSLGVAAAARGEDPRPAHRQAIADGDEALRRNPEDVQALNSRANAFLDLGEAEAARGQDARGSYDRAIADFDRALTLDPELVDAYNNRGNAWRRQGDADAARGEDPRPSYARALADYGAALSRNPNYFLAYSNRGTVRIAVAEFAAGRGEDPRAAFREARADLDEALRRNPGYAEAYNSRGIAHMNLGEAAAARGEDPCASYAQAIADFGSALERRSNYVYALSNRGNAEQLLGDAEAAGGRDPRPTYGRAIADFSAALRQNPGLGVIYSNRANALGALAVAQAARGEDPGANYAAAEADYREALRRHYAPAQLNLGVLFQRMGRFDDAIAALEAGKRADPGHAEWADRQLAETRRLREAARGDAGPPAAWAGELAAGEQAIQAGDYAAARAAYERGLAHLDAHLAQQPAADRKRLLAESALRATLASVHYNFACILALASAGRAGPAAEPQPVAAADAARLRDAAFDHLARALELGWSDRAHLESDRDLEALHDDPRWAGTIAGPRK